MKHHWFDSAYRIGQVARETGLTPDTLRYYERFGLLPPSPRTSGGFRMYTAATLTRLRFIKQAQALGLSLEQIQDLVAHLDNGGREHCRRVRELLAAKLGGDGQNRRASRVLRDSSELRPAMRSGPPRARRYEVPGHRRVGAQRIVESRDAGLRTCETGPCRARAARKRLG